MSRKYKFRNPEGTYFVSFAVVYWIDVFIRDGYRKVLIDSLNYCTLNKGLEIYAYCIMTSHVHLIIGTKQNKLEDIMRDFKSFTSRNIKEAIKENITESRREWMLWMMERAGKKNSNNNDFQFWQQHNQPIELTNPEIFKQKFDYIHNNPVVSGFVQNPEDYIYSSARDYAGLPGNIKLTLAY